jgi:hypothetical protein
MRSQGTKDDGKPESRGRPRLIFRPLSRTGENPPYGILGETMETSASFEGRSAPSSYPTVEALVRIRAGGDQRWSSLPRHLFLPQRAWAACRVRGDGGFPYTLCRTHPFGVRKGRLSFQIGRITHSTYFPSAPSSIQNFGVTCGFVDRQQATGQERAYGFAFSAITCSRR